MKLPAVFRDRRLRHAHGYASISLVSVVLAVTGVVVAGHGPTSTLLHLADGSAWLGNAKRGMVTLVNGSVGRPSATVGVGSNGHRLKVTQTGDGVIVTDLDTGEVRRVDPTNLQVSQAVAYDAANLDVVQQGTTTYAVDHRRGRVIRIDPTTLRPLGAALALPGPSNGNAIFDRHGVLWVGVETTGAVYPIDQGRLGQSVVVGVAGSRLRLAIANGRLAVVVADQQKVTVLEGTRIARTLHVPELAAGDLQVAAEAAGWTLPVVSTTAGRLVLVDVLKGTPRSVTLDGGVRGHQLGAPAFLAGRVYVPDYTTGSVIVYDAAAARFARPIRVTGGQGKFDAFLKGGYLWLNDQGSSRAVVVGSDGRPRSVDKYADNVARPRPKQGSKQPPGHSSLGSGPPASGPPAVPPPGGRGPTLPAKAGVPGVPSSVLAKPGNASLTGSWVAPASGGSAIGYYVATAHPVGGGAAVTRRTARAVTSVVVPRLRNGAAYRLTVHAVNRVGRGPESAPTAPVTPLPGQPEPPSKVTATRGPSSADVTWRPSTGRTLQPLLGYRVYVEYAADHSVVRWLQVAGPESNSVHVPDLRNGISYIVEISAYTATTESGRAASLEFVPATTPAAPAITAATPGTYRVSLTWSLPDDGGRPVDRYTVLVDDAVYASILGTNQEIGLRRADRALTFKVVAHNELGDGPPSAPVSATPNPGLYANWDHYKYRVSIRSAPTPKSDLVGSLPVVPSGREGERMPLHCQAAGAYFTDPGDGSRSHIWDHINYHGIVGYVNDLYIHTPGWNTDRFSPEIPQC
jgi:Fibronectin type III domain